jgi:hypothetical protein
MLQLPSLRDLERVQKAKQSYLLQSVVEMEMRWSCHYLRHHSQWTPWSNCECIALICGALFVFGWKARLSKRRLHTCSKVSAGSTPSTWSTPVLYQSVYRCNLPVSLVDPPSHLGRLRETSLLHSLTQQPSMRLVVY